VGVLIDDLGTGYSSLSALRSLPVGGVKIDRSFVADVASNPAVATITEGVIGIVRGLGLELVAEGVETREQMEFLHSRGCHVMQGYLLGKPVEAAEFAEGVSEGDAFWERALRENESG
jgi:EAL domain-containing protein (putative c-di-GMP-specific phosphodiesterase class I)